MGVVSAIVYFLRAVVGDRAAMAAENLALRQQLAVLQVSARLPRLRQRDRILWARLSRLWSGWPDPFVERLVGSIPRDCLDHVIVFSEAHPLRNLREYFVYYHEARTHLSLNRNAPIPCQVEPLSHGRVIAIPQVGGLHHRHTRAAA